MLIFAVSACNNKQKHLDQNNKSKLLEEAIGIQIPTDSLEPPIVVQAGVPVAIQIPTSTGGSYIVHDEDGDKKIELVPPVTKALPIVVTDIDESSVPASFKPSNNQYPSAMGFFTTFTTDQGLVLDGIASGFRDGQGNLWFGTYGGGASMYDGKSFTNFTMKEGLADNYILSITQDNQGDLWFGTYGGGVSRYDGQTFTNYTTAQGLANNYVFAISQDSNGHLWFATYGGGASRYDGKTFKNYSTEDGLANNKVFCIKQDIKGNLWFGTDGGGVSRYDGKTFTNYTTTHGLANNKVFSITQDTKENLWFGTDGGGASRYDGKSFTNFTSKQGLANDIVSSITQDVQGNVWFGTNGGGLSRYDGNLFTNLTTAQGLANNKVFSITQDTKGNLWFGTNGGGLSRCDGKSFINYTTAQGLANNSVLSILQDKNDDLWFGTFGGGLSKYDGSSFTNFTTEHGLANNSVLSIAQDIQGNLWFGTFGGGLSRYDGNSFTNFTTAQGLANNNVLSITEDHQGNLWCGTYGGGLSKYDGKTFTNYTTAQGLANNFVYSIAQDSQQNLWLGTYGGGLSRYDGKSFLNFNTVQGLPDNVVTQVLMIKENPSNNFVANIAIGTNSGVAVITGFEPIFSQKNGGDEIVLAQNMLLNQELINYKPVIEIYNSSTGYPIKDVNAGQNTMFLDNQGIIWAGTGSDKTGLVRFDYAVLEKNREPPKVDIQNVKLNSEPICWYAIKNKELIKNIELDPMQYNVQDAEMKMAQFNAFGNAVAQEVIESQIIKYSGIQFDSITKFYPIPENLVLPYKHNNVSFEFNAIETGRNFLINYQYILEGYDKEWNPVTKKTNATFGNINDGTYTFKLKALSPSGVWCDPIEYTFEVLPPLYRTWWALLIYFISISGVLVLAFRWRTAALRVQKVMLEQTIRVRTAEVVAEKKEVEKQKQRSDELLLNILPSEVAEELKEKGIAEAKQFDAVTVMFTDFKDFTQIAEKLSPKELVSQIHTYFKAFDEIIGKYNIEKIKTIGDSYMAAGGLPVPNKTHAIDVIMAALEIQQFMEAHYSLSKIGKFSGARIGIHTGPVVAGIVGVKKFAYDTWGDTVNIASRMETSGAIGKVNISGATYELVKDKFRCVPRGKVKAKNKGEIDMYFVEAAL